MYTLAKNAQIVLALLKQHNIRHIVISPGGTNIPITQGVQNDSFFTCYSVVDERSAMYFAIGLYLELGMPIATSCTSAQATRNYIPGLTEAFYKHAPILALTTSKHPRYTYQEFMQAPDQTTLPNDAVKATFALPHINSYDDEIHCERLVNEAILELTHRTPGPVQINIPIIETERVRFEKIQLPKVRTIKRYMEWEEWDIQLKNKKIMIVVGEHRPFSKNQTSKIEEFVETHNAFVYVNHLSNYHGKYAVYGNLAALNTPQDIFFEIYKPDVLITIGGQTGDYPLFSKLSAGNKFDFEHWRVSPDGNIVDTYDKLTKVFECPFEQFFIRFTSQNRDTHTFYNLWSELQRSISIPEELPFSNTYLAQQLHKDIPSNSYLNFAILNSLRMWSLFPLNSSITCYANVAAFGIDGCMSVLFGQSVSTDKLCFMVIGDLAFFYDMNSLGIRHLKNNIRILLINNDCGAEFELSQLEIDTDTYIAAKGHNGNVKGWAESNGFKYISANTKNEFLQLKDEFLNKDSNQSIIFEVLTTSENEVNAYNIVTKLNRSNSKLKDGIKAVIGDKGIKNIKTLLNKH